MSSRHPKVETFATLSAKVAEYERVFPMVQAQAQQAMMMAAEEKGKYLHVLKLFAAVVAQNMHKGIPTVVLHKSVVDQPDTINIAREPYPSFAAEEEQTGYSYRIIEPEELQALSAGVSEEPTEPESTLLDASGNLIRGSGEEGNSAANEGDGVVRVLDDGGTGTDGEAPVVSS